MVIIAPPFESSIFHRIRNRPTTTFWYDNWQCKPLKFLFPNLYQLAQQKQVSVADCIHDTSWLLQLPMPTSEARSEKDELLLFLQQQSITQHQDQVIWLRHQTTFSVSSAYMFLCHTPSPSSLIKNIWRIRAPLRITIFTWLLLNNRLTMIDNLVRRGWQLPNMCAMCKRNEETTAHLFQQCILGKEVRAYIYEAFKN